MRTCAILLCCLVLMPSRAAAEDPPAADGARWVVLVSGINRDPDENQAKARALLGMRAHLLLRGGLPQSRLFVLQDPEAVAPVAGAAAATRAAWLETLAQLAGRMKPVDELVLFYTGQANIVNEVLRFNLRGPDLCHDELVSALDALPAERQWLLLDCPGSGLLIKPLARPGRLVIAAAGADQPYSTRFSQWFIPALGQPACDLNADGKVSLLEAFQETATQLERFYEERDLLRTEHPLLEDDGDGIGTQKPWKYEESGHDGALAARSFLD